jgi:putative Mn2+ efflux pump MntP
MKFALNISSFSEVISYESFGIAIGALILYMGTPMIRKAFHKTNAKLTRKARALILANESLTILAKAFMFFAFSIGPVTLVSIVEGTQTFIAIGYGLILGTLLPKVFKGEAHIPDLPKKLGCAALALVGLYLLT